MVIYDPATTNYNLYDRENNVPYDPSISPNRFDSVTGMRYASTYNQIIFLIRESTWIKQQRKLSLQD